MLCTVRAAGGLMRRVCFTLALATLSALTGCTDGPSPVEKSAAALAALEAPSASWVVEDPTALQSLLAPPSGEGPPASVLRVGRAVVHLDPAKDPTSATVAWRRTVPAPEVPQACAEVRAWAERAQTRFGLDVAPREVEQSCLEEVPQAPMDNDLRIVGSGASAYAAVPGAPGRQRHLFWAHARSEGPSESAPELRRHTLLASVTYDYAAN
jgi:hypothetical protein